MKKGPKNGLIFVISGPSGSGKTTLAERILKEGKLKRSLVKSVSFTTRKPRSNEKEARHYFFISEAEFRSLRRARKILEWTKYLGYYYGTSRDFVEEKLKKGKHIILCLDLKGAKIIKRLYPKRTVRIFILPPSLKTLRERIEGRCVKVRAQEIQGRLELAARELLRSKEYDYCIVNKNLGEATERLKGIVLKEIAR
ncbi:MAG: guanylate kinase [Candidatus Omnitrophota bacterium]